MSQKKLVATSTNKSATRKTRAGSIAFFSFINALGFIAAPLYIIYNGVAVSTWVLFAFYMIATGLSITCGYHRLFAHVTYKTNKLIKFLMLFFGAAAFEQSALKWSSQHRRHHRFVDTELDPYNIKKGFFHAHIGWILFWKQHADYSNVVDLDQDKMIKHQHDHYLVWSLGAGVLLPLLIGALTGHIWGAFFIAVGLRMVIVYHSTFFINSLCHTLGNSTYDAHSTAKDHWFAAILTYGEGYHNFHHRFPSDYRNGVKWHHWDPSKWAISFMSRVGLAWDLRRTPKFQILAAILESYNQKLQTIVQDKKVSHISESKLRWLEVHLKKITPLLANWKHVENQYQTALKNISIKKEAILQYQEKIKQAKADFYTSLSEWITQSRLAFGTL